jgi:hypothetical protein
MLILEPKFHFWALRAYFCLFDPQKVYVFFIYTKFPIDTISDSSHDLFNFWSAQPRDQIFYITDNFCCFTFKLSHGADFLVQEKVALTHVKQQQCIWLELSNAFDCASQKENILLNTDNKRIIGVLTRLVYLLIKI